MSDRTPDRGDRTPVDVAEAARRLGITPDAVRARIRRGSLEGQKEGGTWRVMVPRDTGQDTDRIPTGHDTTPDPPPAGLISQLQSEVDYLRSELTAALRTAEREREGQMCSNGRHCNASRPLHQDHHPYKSR